MKNWYKTRDEITGSQHRGQELQPNKFIKMSEAQALQHNKDRENLVLQDNPPSSVADCQFVDEFEVLEEKQTLVSSPKKSKKDSPRNVE